MARPVYEEVPNGIFHLTSRGNARRMIYRDDEDYRAFLLVLKRTVKRHEWRCLAYCLMPNHFHLLVQTPAPTRADGMRDLKSEYAQLVHRRYGTDGGFFRPRYKPQLIQEDGYLLAAALYLAKNPVRAGLVRDPAGWPWSSFAADDAFVNPTPFLSILSSDSDRARINFSELARGRSPDFDPKPPIVGDEDFIRRHAPAMRPGREVVKQAWEQARPSLSRLSEGVDEIEFVHHAREGHWYTIREIAEHLDCSPETVRRRLRLWDGET